MKKQKQLIKLTFTDQVIEWMYRNCDFMSANDFDGYAIDASRIYPDYYNNCIRVLLDICGNVFVIANPAKYKKPQKKARKFFNKLLRDGFITLYDDPNEPFEEFSLRHNIPIKNDDALLLDQNVFSRSKIWEDNIDNVKETC